MTRCFWKLLSGLTLGFLVIKLVNLLINAFTFPYLKSADLDPNQRVSLLIPARNEAQNLKETLPSLLSQGALEVIVLDDNSSDETGELSRQLGAKVISGQPLPEGWVGKTWACEQLGQAAKGDIFIFVDADVSWHQGALAAVVAEMKRSKAGLLSVFPKQDNKTLGERLLTPQVDSTILTYFPAPLLNVPHASAAAANGQVMAFTRETYRHLGGHACVRAELLEDIAFSRQVKLRGERLSLALGKNFIGVRMYRSYTQSVRGFAKSMLPMHGGKRELLVANIVGQFVCYTLPMLRGQWGLVALAMLEALSVRLLTNRTKPGDLAEVLLAPLQPLFYLPVAWISFRKEAVWKGREYTFDHHRSYIPKLSNTQSSVSAG